jgi:hypothetical protein
VHTYNLGYLGDWKWESQGLRPPHENSSWDLGLQNNQSKMDWRCGSNSSVPALQAWSPEFNPRTIDKEPNKTCKDLSSTSQEGHPDSQWARERHPTLLLIRETQITATVGNPCTPAMMTTLMTEPSVGEVVGQSELIHFWWGNKWYNHFGKHFDSFQQLDTIAQQFCF